MSAFLAWLVTYRYAIIFPLAILEGPILMFFCGFLLRLGFFDLLPLYPLLVAGDFIADLFWYAIGRYAAQSFVTRFGRFFNISLIDVERLAILFRQRHTAAIPLSKMTMGFGFALATLTAAGVARIPIRTYASLILAGGFVWTALLLTFGFIVGGVYMVMPPPLRFIFVSFVIIGALVVAYSFNRYMRTHIGRTLTRTP